MEFLSKFRLSLARTFLRFKFKKSEVSKMPVNFANAKKIGIVYTRDNKLSESAILKTINDLLVEQKKVYSLEYIKQDSDADYRLKEKHHFSLRDEDINFFKLPKQSILKSFCHESFDIIINLSREDIEVVHHAVALCESRMKAGFVTQEYGFLYDVMLDPGSNKDMTSLSANLVKLLKQVNKK